MLHKYLLLFILISIAYQSDARDTYEQLKEADKIRSTDTEGFSKQLKELEKRYKKFSDEEKLYFDYLSTFNRAFSGNLHKVVDDYKRILSKSNDDYLKIRAASSIVNIHAITRSFREGYNSLPALQEMIGRVEGDSKHIGLVALAIFFNQAEEYELGLKYASSVASDSPSERNNCFSQNLIHESLFNLKKVKNLHELEQVIRICEEQNEHVSSSLAILWKASILLEKDLYKEALKTLASKEKTFMSSNYPRVISEYYSTLSLANFNLGNLVDAKSFSELAISKAASLGNSKPLVMAYSVLSKIEETSGNFEQSLFYYKKYAEADKAYLDEVKAKQLAIQQAKHDAMEKANQIALLDKENTLLKTQARLTKEEQENNRLFMAFLMLVILMVVLWAYKNRRMHLKIRQQAETDDLTGISNRGHFSQVAESALSYHKKTHQPLAFVIFDLDLFKNVNDQFGHQVGDWALKAAVDALKRVCREQDQIGRMGGEEFAILLPGCSIGKAMQVAEACRLAIEAIDTSPSGEHFTLTASFGVADTLVCGYEFDQLYGCADHALYQSKENGRNRVYRYIQDTSANPLSTQQTQ